MSDESIEREQLRKALLQHWPLLTTAILSETFPTDASPGPFIQSAIAQDGPDKARFVAIFDCLERNAKETTLHRDQIQSELTKRVEEYEADLIRATRRISDFDQVIATQTEELLETRAKITGLNAEITRLNSCVTQHNERISTLQDEKTELQTRLAQATTANGPPIHFGTTPKARRTTTNPDKFTAGQQDTAKRQSAYERWKTQVEQILVVDAECFPKALDILTFITSLLGGKAWDAVQDGVQTMNANPKNSQLWTWQNPAALWEALDKRYMLLDSTQSAKNMLDTLHQGNRAYGDFKADFDHYADKARLDSRSKVDMLRKRLNGAFTAVIDNQITLPAADDYAGWTNVTDNIARNLQQKEHITKLRNIAKPHPEAHAQDRVAPAVDAGDPMELDRIRISDAERRRRTDNDLCLACGEPGHFARDHHRPVDPVPMPRRQANTRSTFQSTHARGRGRGRGGYNTQASRTQPQGQTQQQGSWQWMPQTQFQQPQFLTPQLRALPTGHIIGETSSENTSVTGDDISSTYTAPDAQGHQLKGPPLD